MKNDILLVFLILAVVLCFGITQAHCQAFVPVSASGVHNGDSTLLPSGTIQWQAVDGTGNPISYQPGGGGQQILFPTVCAVSNGAITGSCLVANTALTNPANVCFMVTVKNGYNQTVLGGSLTSGYGCVQPATANSWCTAGACNFDQYVPNSSGIPTAILPPPTALSLGGVFSETCTALNFVTGVDTSGNLTCAPLTALGQPTKRLYVDGTRTDSYTANGSLEAPFKTIMAAANQVITNADNSTYLYLIDVQPAVYAETINLSNTALVQLMFEGHGGQGLSGSSFSAFSSVSLPGVIVAPGSGNSLQSLSNNDGLRTLQFSGFQFNSPVALADTVNNGHMASNAFVFVDDYFPGGFSISNAFNVILENSGIAPTSLSLTNVGLMLWINGFFLNGTLSMTTTSSPVPNNFLGSTQLTIFGWAFGPNTITLSGSTTIAEQLGGFGASAGTTTLTLSSGQTFLMENPADCYCNIVVNSGGTFLNNGGTVQGSVTINAGGTYTPVGAAALNKILLGPKLCQILTGSGAPAVAAPVCSIYTRTDGGSGSTLYVKETGSSTSSGWVAK